jgi:hypothetical protein
LTVLPRTPSGRFSGSADYSISVGGGGGGGTGYRGVANSSGGVGGGTGSYWTFISSVYAYYPATSGSINTGGGGGGGGSSTDTNSGASDSGANGGSGVVYLIYERSPS